MENNKFNNIEEIAKRYPEGITAFRNWLAKTVGLGEQDESLSEKLIVNLLQVGNRMLFDFFDAQMIYITLSVSAKNTWAYNIKSDSHGEMNNGKTYTSRIKAEIDAFGEAFDILEHSLKSKK